MSENVVNEPADAADMWQQIVAAMKIAEDAYLRGDRAGAVAAWRKVTREIPNVPRAWAGVLSYAPDATLDEAAQGYYLLAGGLGAESPGMGAPDPTDPDVWTWLTPSGEALRGRLAWHDDAFNGLMPTDIAFLAMGLGYWYERRGDFVASAWMFGVRHNLTLAMHPHPTARIRELVDNVAQLAAAVETPGDTGETRLLFLCGVPRCGSTVLARSLAAHPDVIEIGENGLFDTALRGATNEEGTSLEQARDLAATALDELVGMGAPRIIVNKQLNTWLWAPIIQRMYPRARFVDLRRNSVEQAISCWRTDFAMATLSWATTWRGIAAYMQLADHAVENARALAPDSWRTVDYEAFAADPEPVLRDLLAWCDLPWDDAVLHPERRGTNVIDTASTFQAREPIKPPATWADRYPEQAAEFASLYGDKP